MRALKSLTKRRPTRDSRCDYKRERAVTWSLLATLSATFLVYCSAFVPRLTNNHFGDIEFSGWSGAIGSRLLDGARPYIDFVLPIPPGSFAVLAAIEWISGRALLIQELWLNAIMHLTMGLLAYAIVVPLTSRKNALLVAATTLVTVIQLNKECAYDHTAQMVSWASFVPAVRALLSDETARRRNLWILTGMLAGSTLLFKQSTAIGAIFGWCAALGYSAIAELVSGHRSEARARLHDSMAFGRGTFYGLSFVWFSLLMLGSSAEAFFQAVFRDASSLKGGTSLLLRNIGNYLLSYPSYPGSLAIIFAFVLIGARLVRKRSTLHLGDEPQRSSPFGLIDIIAFVVLVLGGLVFAAVLLKFGPAGYPYPWIREIDRLKQIPMFGLIFASAFFVAHLVRIPHCRVVPVSEDRTRVGHIYNAIAVAALTATILHNTSAPEFRPFYDNNPIVFVGFFAALVAFDRADLRWLQFVAVALLVGSLFGNKFFRAMTATIEAPANTHWAHLRVTDRGETLIVAARRARELARPDETVLVLPEDMELEALIGRPRPHITGAIVFVDQYPAHLVRDDFARIAAHPPKVIVVHPRREIDWQKFFRIWSGASGAEQLMRSILVDLLPNMYRLDSSFSTSFIYESGQLDIYVREDAE